MRGAESQIGKSWYTPGSFRKSGKQWIYRIRNLEEYAVHRKEGSCKMIFYTGKGVESRKSSSKSLGMEVMTPIPPGHL